MASAKRAAPTMEHHEELQLPATMRAIFATETGEPQQVLKIKQLPIPQITSPDQVLIRVLFAAVNPVDWKIISGRLYPISLMIRKPAHVTGSDFSGRVVAKGTAPELNYLNAGDLVFGNSEGAFAEFMVAPASKLCKMPQCLSPKQAAAIPLVTQTSFQALQKLKVKEGEKLLILGGSTATGLMAIQIAKHHIGCSEVVVTSTQEELCKKSGADRVINYRTERWAVLLKDYGFDAVYDCVGGVDYWDSCRSQGVLKKKGRFATIVGDTQHGAKLSVGSMVGMGLSVANRKFWGTVGYQSYDFVPVDATKNMADIAALVESGKLEPVLDPDSPFDFEDFLKVFAKSMDHSARGKLVINIANEAEDEEEYKANDDGQDEEHEERGGNATN